jgi:hypothetical protein
MHIKRISLRIATAAGVLAASTLFAQMNHGSHADHQHGGMAPAEHALALPEPAQSVFTNYLNIQTALAGDSFQGVRNSATAMLTSIRSDSAGTFSAEVAQAAEELAKATDITVGRQEFKRLSGTLIKYLDAHKEHASHLVKAFCPMANAVWLQTGSIVNNPYMGKQMAHCGEIRS